MSRTKQLTITKERNPLFDLETPLGGLVAMANISNRMLEGLTDKLEQAGDDAKLHDVITTADMEAAIWAANHLRNMIRNFEERYYAAFNMEPASRRP